MPKQIEDYINENLKDEANANALKFVDFLRAKDAKFYKDESPFWKDKIYYHIKFYDEIIAYISIKDPDEPGNLWTVWLNDNNEAFNDSRVEPDIKNAAWKHIDFCARCGSCSGGKKKTVFGKVFEGVCFLTFRIDNPTARDLPFLKKMIELCKAYFE